MVVLAHKVDKAPLWAAAADGNDFPFFVLGDLSDARRDGEGMSWWEIATTEDYPRLAAALYMGTSQNSAPTATFYWVETDFLDSAAIKHVRTKGRTFDEELSDRHFDVQDIDGHQALSLAKQMIHNGPVIVKPEVYLAAYAGALAAKKLPHKELKKDGLWTLKAQRHVAVAGTTIEP